MAYEHFQPGDAIQVATVVAIFLLAILVAPPAQAQTFTVLHTFTGGADEPAHLTLPSMRPAISMETPPMAPSTLPTAWNTDVGRRTS